MTKTMIKILKDIDGIAKKGPDYYIDYTDYIDKLFEENKLFELENAFIKKYGIKEGSDYKSKKIYGSIMMQTKSKLQESLKKLFDSKGVYFVTINVYNSSDNTFLGSIKEIEVDGKIILEVDKEGSSQIVYIEDETYDLVKKYEIAIGILKDY